jgi:epoxyqueuosine reductase
LLTRDALLARARAAGFDLCGIARASRHPRLARLAEWIAEGRAGEMTYLGRSLDERLDPARVLPTVQSIVSVAVVYNTDNGPATAVSRYAWGRDYHDVLRERLTALLQWMAETAGPGFEAFSCVDSGPVQERVFAAEAGLGWIGKNTCLINPALGSWLFLGEILTNLVLDPDEAIPDQCGSCTKCLDACPTGALTDAYSIDATRCLSYLTIETRGEVAEEWRTTFGDRIYGCDICQDVCPWNRRAATSSDPAWRPRDALTSPRLIDLCRLTDQAWRALMRDSAMRRAGVRRVRRSLAYAAASADRDDAEAALEALASQPSAGFPEVADAISWARTKIGRDILRSTSMREPRDAGMTLVEMLIVLAIIAIISAIAAAGLLRSRAAANEAGAIAAVRATSSAQKAYAATCGSGAYATSYVVLGTPIGGTAGFISADLGSVASPIKSGFQFNVTAGAGATPGPMDCLGRPTTTAIYVTAVPVSVVMGARSFAMNGNGTVWQISGSIAPTEPFGPPAQPIQ